MFLIPFTVINKISELSYQYYELINHQNVHKGENIFPKK